MKVLIWIVMTILTTGLIHGAKESNPYKEALRARPWESVQNYVTVRPGAHMFYWLYYADGKKTARTECKPLIIWIQGGPGYAASGLGNFGEIGPLTIDMEPRNNTWVKGRNVLMFDHPVGTGFSYVMNNTLLVKTDQEMANDLTKAIMMFLVNHPGFRDAPTFIFGQGYGGKICPILAYYLNTAIKNNSLKMNLKGIGIGSGFVDPKTILSLYPDNLLNIGLITRKSCNRIDARVQSIFIDRNIHKDYKAAADLLRSLFEIMFVEVFERHDMPLNFHNCRKPNSKKEELLNVQMNAYVKPALSHVVDQTIEWVFMSEIVNRKISEDLLTPSLNFLERLLNETELKVAVYNGDLDVQAPLSGTIQWVDKLNWHGYEQLHNAKRIKIPGLKSDQKYSFYKTAKQMSLWCVLEAGQWMTQDSPEAMAHILDYVISGYD